ncbi:hypothetical protein AB0451_24175 [Streptomyces sp. NPDC052000]|uniref:WD40 repeat domain-containing protein n=1 Tax=Streptomyces sp. NPDC052000 TaxID=3155676 RepID=UPI00344D8053
MQPGNIVVSLAFSPDGRLLASATNYGAVQIWDIASGDLLGTLDKLPTGDRAPNQIAFSPDGKTLAVCCVPQFQLVDVAKRKILHSLALPSWAVAFSPNGKTIAVGGQNGLQFVTASGQARTVTSAYSADDLAFSPDGSLLATGGLPIRLLDTVTGSIRSVLGAENKGPGQSSESIAFSPDGTLIASGGSLTGESTSSLLLWNVASGTNAEVGTEVTNDEIHSVAFSPDGAVLVSADEIGHLRLWDTATKRQLADLFTGTSGALGTVAVSPQGGLLATGSSNAITLWDVNRFIPAGKRLSGTPKPPVVAPKPSLSVGGPSGTVGAGTDCGTAGTDSDGRVFRVVVIAGHVTCPDAIQVLQDYAQAPGKQGSGGFATVDGWSCGHNSMAGLSQTGVYMQCGRGADSFDTQVSPASPSP